MWDKNDFIFSTARDQDVIYLLVRLENLSTVNKTFLDVQYSYLCARTLHDITMNEFLYTLPHNTFDASFIHSSHFDTEIFDYQDRKWETFADKDFARVTMLFLQTYFQ